MIIVCPRADQQGTVEPLTPAPSQTLRMPLLIELPWLCHLHLLLKVANSVARHSLQRFLFRLSIKSVMVPEHLRLAGTRGLVLSRGDLDRLHQ